ncbi:MAG: 30S ribosome-binding factor RbfA [Gammaproteobacteria bacterium]|nr:30S ribosome-binding factor RbfA [Gammaproteobacteria bacterium]
MPREFSRSQRLGTQILRSLSELLRFETKDPRLNDVSLTSVDLSRDLSVARVYFSLLNPEDSPDEAMDGLNKASGFLRAKLGSAIKVRHIPELRFFHDDSAAQSDKISQLINKALHSDDHR